MSLIDFTEIKFVEIKNSDIVFSKKTHLWCKLPYPNHPKGCPNYNRNPLCPPFANYMDYIKNIYSRFYLVYANFKLKSQKERMLLLHPNWTEKKANCLLYWQSSVKKALRNYIQEIILKNKNREIYILACGSGFNFSNISQDKIYSMEAVGVNVLKTLKNAGIEYELKPKNKVVLTTLLCSQEKLLLS
ncbi:hypothetical protein LCGC14_1145260 [marine sediment metagenome]|uniref:DUF2284 domain-containing protein n=1 Tax=marine sediment metagenome TaxID=412755 RepID=A0A0F9PF74_9ZZZZ